MRMISDGEAAALLTHPQLVEALAAAHREHAEARLMQPVPSVLPIPDEAPGADAARHVLMSVTGGGLTLVKVLLDAPRRRQRQEPAQRSVVSVYDSATGDGLAVIDGRTLTRMRTAAATVLAVRTLASGTARIGVIGAGALAAEHIRCAASVLGTNEFVLWARRPDAVATLGEVAASEGARWRAADSPSEVVAAAEAVIMVTPAREPLIGVGDLRPGVHISAVGSPPRPGYREVTAEAINAADVVVVDDARIAVHESAQLQAALRAGLEDNKIVEIGAVLSGAHPGRTSADQVTVHSSIGVALQDLAAARLLLGRTDGPDLG